MADSADNSGLTHLTADGEAHMVDVSDKAVTQRTARASAKISGSPHAIDALWSGDVAKGDALAAARIAGIMATKRTADLIPLCHPIPVTGVEISISRIADTPSLVVSAEVHTTGVTGVEMEALTAASVAALTLYDMAKALDKSLVISDVQLETKTGGKSGDYRRGSSDE